MLLAEVIGDACVETPRMSTDAKPRRAPWLRSVLYVLLLLLLPMPWAESQGCNLLRPPDTMSLALQRMGSEVIWVALLAVTAAVSPWLAPRIRAGWGLLIALLGFLAASILALGVVLFITLSLGGARGVLHLAGIAAAAAAVTAWGDAALRLVDAFRRRSRDRLILVFAQSDSDDTDPDASSPPG